MYKVYMHKLKKDNRVYIGITKQNLKKRWQRGIGYAHSTNFYNAILKYGWDDFDHIVLFKDLSKEEAEQKEMELIKLYNSNVVVIIGNIIMRRKYEKICNRNVWWLL